MGMLPSAEVQDDATHGNWLSTQICVWSGLRTRQTQQNCLYATQERVWSSFWLGLFSCWWNYKLAEALYSQGRLRGVNNHMALQLMVLVVRAAALWGLDQTWLKDSAIPLNAAHGVMLIFLLLVSIDTYHPKDSTNSSTDNHNIPPRSPSHQSPSRLLLRPPTNPRRPINNSKTHLLRIHPHHIRLPNLIPRPTTLPRINLHHIQLR
jgi:hypothetical protein